MSVSLLMGLAITATAFGIMRAASLGIDTGDLTCKHSRHRPPHSACADHILTGDYAIVAIWSNVELWVAIIAANLALARSMYLHFSNRRSSLNESDQRAYYTHQERQAGGRAGTIGSHGRQRSNGGKRGIFDITLNSRADATQLAPGDPEDNVVWSECRRASSTRSATASEIPLEPQIQTKTEFQFFVQSDGHSEMSNGGQIEAVEEGRKPRRFY